MNKSIKRNVFSKGVIASLLLIMGLTVLINNGFAATKKNKPDKKEKPEKNYPTGCKTIGYEFSHGLVILTPIANNQQSQTIYFIQNKSTQDITLMQQRHGAESYIMHSNVTIKANQWAAFANDLKSVKFICTKAKEVTNTQSILDCENLLKICEYPNAKFPISARGSYWAAANMSLSTLVREIVRQGMLLKS